MEPSEPERAAEAREARRSGEWIEKNGHNPPICDECKTQSAKIVKLPNLSPKELCLKLYENQTYSAWISPPKILVCRVAVDSTKANWTSPSSWNARVESK